MCTQVWHISVHAPTRRCGTLAATHPHVHAGVAHQRPRTHTCMQVWHIWEEAAPTPSADYGERRADDASGGGGSPGGTSRKRSHLMTTMTTTPTSPPQHAPAAAASSSSSQLLLPSNLMAFTGKVGGRLRPQAGWVDGAAHMLPG